MEKNKLVCAVQFFNKRFEMFMRAQLLSAWTLRNPEISVWNDHVK